MLTTPNIPTKNGFEKFNLSGKTALITGAAGLLGIQHTIALLDCGATVVLTDVAESYLAVARESVVSHACSDAQVICKVMDVSQFDEVSDVATTLQIEGHRIDILVNNAAINPKIESKNNKELTRLENFSIKQWNIEVGVGLTGAFLCSQAFGSRMAADGKGGVILNIASDLSVVSPDQRLYLQEGLSEEMQPVKPVSYSVIKSGLIGLTRYLSTYWAHKGVRANALSPGGVFNGQDEVFVKRLTSLIPLGRMASHDEYRSAVQFLCSDASSYLNGQNILIDGGRSVL